MRAANNSSIVGLPGFQPIAARQCHDNGCGNARITGNG